MNKDELKRANEVSSEIERADEIIRALESGKFVVTISEHKNQIHHSRPRRVIEMIPDVEEFIRENILRDCRMVKRIKEIELSKF